MIATNHNLAISPNAIPPPVRDYLSYSAIRTYQNCPLRYYFKYIVGLPEGAVGAILVFGSAIHRSIEHHYREIMIGGAPPSTEAMLEHYKREWQQRQEQEVRFGKSETIQTLDTLAQRLLKAFEINASRLSEGSVLAIEETVMGELIAGMPPLLGRVDLITESASALTIHDWKTSRSRWSAGQIADASEQLLLYSELAQDFAPGKSIQIAFTVFTKTKEVQVEHYNLPVVSKQVSRLKRVIERVWHAIESEQFYPAPTPQGCASCSFRKPCRDWPG